MFLIQRQLSPFNVGADLGESARNFETSFGSKFHCRMAGLSVANFVAAQVRIIAHASLGSLVLNT